MYTEEELNLITVCSIENISYLNAASIYRELGGKLPAFIKIDEQLIKSAPRGVYNKVKGKFFDREYRECILKEYESKGIKCVTVLSKDYPENLKHIPSPPLVLFCKGNIQLLNTDCFAVVGSRRTAANILKECKNFSGQLTRHFTVVTGAADGADSMAIEGAIDSGKLICVLAYGFNYYYPAMNEALIKKVEKKGLLITEYPPKVQPHKYQFPVRNRIIAGLCLGTLIVSAGETSGAAITANCALDYDRQVFAFPYSLGVASGSGCNALIKKGAQLTDNILDIFLSFGLDFKQSEQVQLTEEEFKVYGLVKQDGETFAGDLAAKLNKKSNEIIVLLSMLEIKGKVRRLGGNRFAAL